MTQGDHIGDPHRVAAARRLDVRSGTHTGLDRLGDLAARLLGARASQVSLLTDEQVVAGGSGLAPGSIGSSGPLADSLCTVTARGRRPLVVTDAPADDRVATLSPVTSGQVTSYLGAPIVDGAGNIVGALCVFDPVERSWSDADVALIQQLAAAVMSELELVALSSEYELSRQRWDVAIQAAGIGSFDWDLASDRVDWDERLQALFGFAPGEYQPHVDTAFSRVHPDDRAMLDKAIGAAIEAGDGYQTDFRIVLPDASVRWVAVRGRALLDESGKATRVLGAAYDVTEIRVARDQAAHILETMTAAFFSVDRDWTVTYVNAEGERVLGRAAADLVGLNLWAEFPGADELEFGVAYRQAMDSGEPVAFEAYYPPLKAWFEVRAVPNRNRLDVYFLDITSRRDAEMEADRAATRLELIAKVSAELAATLNSEDAVPRLARLVVPALSDWCLVTLVDDDGGLRDVGWWHAEPEQLPVLEQYAGLRLEALTEASFLARARATGLPVIVADDATERIKAVLRPGTARDLLVELAPETGVVLPLRGRDRTVGLLSLFSGPKRPGLAGQALTTAKEVAERAGLAVDNARLYAQQRHMAESLQLSLLTKPPQPDHGEIEPAYRTAAEEARVGGDWYDAFLQPDGATVLVIGDVVGHDSAAAAAMGQLRGLLRGIAYTTGAGPASVLTHLDSAMRGLQIETTATAVVVRLEQSPDERERGITRLRWSNAGHPPPMVITPTGAVTELATTEADLLLGIDPGTPRIESEVALDRDSTVLLFTDGLVERRGQSLDEGLARLRAALERRAHQELKALVQGVLDDLVPKEADDDVAVIAVRLHRQDLPRPAEAGPNDVPPGVPPEPDVSPADA